MRLLSFGKVALEGSGFSRPKPLLLLAYVTLEGPQERRRLAALLWKEGDASALGNLSVMLNQFKKQGAAEVFPDTPGINPLPSQVGCDALSFLEALERRDLERAIALYRGPFLQDLGTPLERLHVSEELLDWVLEKREFFAQKIQLALLERAEELLVQHDTRRAQPLIERAYALLEAPQMEPALLSRVQHLLLHTGSSLSKRAGVAAEASLEEISHTALQVFAALALQEQPNLTIVRNALSLPLGELSRARETLILSGLIDEGSRVLAEETALGWLEAHPGERVPLLLALARATPPEDASGLYQQLYQTIQGYGGVGDFARARTAFSVRARAHLDQLEFAEVVPLLEQVRAVERVIEAAPDPQSYFQEAYALERLGRFREALELIGVLPEDQLDPETAALKSVLLWRRGSPLEAQEIAVRVLESGADRLWAKAMANTALGYVTGSAGNFLEAARYYKKAAALFQAAGAKDRWVGSLNNYATELDRISQEYEQKGSDAASLESARADAQDAYQQAFEALAQVGTSPLMQARLLLNMGMLWGRRSDWGNAESHYLAAIPFAEAANALEICARLYLNLGHTYLAQDRGEEARAGFKRAIHFSATAGELLSQGIAMAHLADLDDDPDTLEVALTLMEESGHLDQARTLFKNYEGVLLRLIRRSSELGDHAKSRRLEQRLLSMNPQHRAQETSSFFHTQPVSS